MSRLPSISGREARQAFERAGWAFARQRRTSHMILAKEGKEAILSIPDHKSLKRPLLRNLIKDAEMTREDFLYYLRGRKKR